jgi:hypothetical protein
MIGGPHMFTNQTDILSLLKQGDFKEGFIDLTIAIVSSPYIEDEIKLNIIKRLADGYVQLSKN